MGTPLSAEYILHSYMDSRHLLHTWFVVPGKLFGSVLKVSVGCQEGYYRTFTSAHRAFLDCLRLPSGYTVDLRSAIFIGTCSILDSSCSPFPRLKANTRSCILTSKHPEDNCEQRLCCFLSVFAMFCCVLETGEGGEGY